MKEKAMQILSLSSCSTLCIHRAIKAHLIQFSKNFGLKYFVSLLIQVSPYEQYYCHDDFLFFACGPDNILVFSNKC